MIYLLKFIYELITLYVYVIFARVILSWLVNFGVVNYNNQYVRSLTQLLDMVTEPLLRPIRRMIPNTGVIDISAFILVLGCWFVQLVVLENLAQMFR